MRLLNDCIEQKRMEILQSKIDDRQNTNTFINVLGGILENILSLNCNDDDGEKNSWTWDIPSSFLNCCADSMIGALTTCFSILS